MFLLTVVSVMKPQRTTTASSAARGKKSLDSETTSRGHVAVVMTVWRSGRSWPIMARSCGSKPSSIMRSASSRTTNETLWSETSPASRASTRRPGVTSATSTPRRSWCSSCALEAPPKSESVWMPAPARRLHSSSIWTASSRVGTTMMARGSATNLVASSWLTTKSSSRGSSSGSESVMRRASAAAVAAPPARSSFSLRISSRRLLPHTWTSSGRTKAMVLPEPVSAIPTVSRPLSAAAHTMLCTGVGRSKPMSRITRITDSPTHAGSSPNSCTGGGTPRPSTSIPRSA
mmetsp:Transcript_17353/g.44284  ORF Transcript_17353/g.44284 Transcript_17353/m.44284 type:complete len:289 (+) Transcript_17353:1020-1886(+)